MGCASDAHSWTTLDEIQFVDTMYHKAEQAILEKHRTAPTKVSSLSRYLEVARVRNWGGHGMRVDPGQVILHAEDRIAELKSLNTLKRNSIL